jgi:hypothetical protein
MGKKAGMKMETSPVGTPLDVVKRIPVMGQLIGRIVGPSATDQELTDLRTKVYSTLGNSQQINPSVKEMIFRSYDDPTVMAYIKDHADEAMFASPLIKVVQDLSTIRQTRDMLWHQLQKNENNKAAQNGLAQLTKVERTYLRGVSKMIDSMKTGSNLPQPPTQQP